MDAKKLLEDLHKLINKPYAGLNDWYTTGEYCIHGRKKVNCWTCNEE